MHAELNPLLTLRQAAYVAGFGLLVMTVCAPYAEFYVFPKLIVREDIELTVRNLLEHRQLYTSALWAVFLNYVADIVVAWALYVFFAPVHRHLSLLAALFQLVYATLGLAALMNLFAVLNSANSPYLAEQVAAGQMNTQLHLLLTAYRTEWGVALVLFGIHLLLIGYLAFRSTYVPRAVGVALAVAGGGYVTYVVGSYLLPEVNLGLLMATFLLEPVFMVWLLWKGGASNATDTLMAGSSIPDLPNACS